LLSYSKMLTNICLQPSWTKSK